MAALFIIRTNSQDLFKEALASGYKTLWEVENAFREVKDFIKFVPSITAMMIDGTYIYLFPGLPVGIKYRDFVWALK